MRRFGPNLARVGIFAVFLFGLLGTGCDVRPLQQDELSPRPVHQPTDTPAAPDAGDTADAAFEARLPTETGNPEMGTADATISDAAIADADAADAPPGCPATACGPFERCDLMMMACVLRTGPGILSGSVTDGCTGRGIAARVGIAGHRQCSVDGKGGYFFNNLPEGNLALIAFKEGYKHFEVVVAVSSRGTVQNIVLQPDTSDGCLTAPADIACTCNLPGCP